MMEKQFSRKLACQNMDWRKWGRSHDSLSGFHTAVGLQTRKIISYASGNKMCQICDEVSKGIKKQ